MKKQFFAQKGFVINSNNKVLFIKYANSKFLPAKLDRKWALPGGKIEMGETPDESIINEVKEETGIICKPLSPFYVWNWEYKRSKDDVQINAIIRLCKYIKGKPLVFKKQEKELDIVEVKWIPMKKLKTLDIVEDEAVGVKLYLKEH